MVLWPLQRFNVWPICWKKKDKDKKSGLRGCVKIKAFLPPVCIINNQSVWKCVRLGTPNILFIDNRIALVNYLLTLDVRMQRCGVVVMMLLFICCVLWAWEGVSLVVLRIVSAMRGCVLCSCSSCVCCCVLYMFCYCFYIYFWCWHRSLYCFEYFYDVFSIVFSVFIWLFICVFLWVLRSPGGAPQIVFMLYYLGCPSTK